MIRCQTTRRLGGAVRARSSLIGLDPPLGPLVLLAEHERGRAASRSSPGPGQHQGRDAGEEQRPADDLEAAPAWPRPSWAEPARRAQQADGQPPNCATYALPSSERLPCASAILRPAHRHLHEPQRVVDVLLAGEQPVAGVGHDRQVRLLVAASRRPGRASGCAPRRSAATCRRRRPARPAGSRSSRRRGTTSSSCTDQLADLVAAAERAEGVLDVLRVLGEVEGEVVPVARGRVPCTRPCIAAYASVISSALNGLRSPSHQPEQVLVRTTRDQQGPQHGQRAGEHENRDERRPLGGRSRPPVNTRPVSEIAVAPPQRQRSTSRRCCAPCSPRPRRPGRMTPMRGYISPMPAAGDDPGGADQPRRQLARGREHAAAMPATQQRAPFRSAARWSSRAPSRACTCEAPAQPERADGQRGPGQPRRQSYCSWSR